jgi:hypothetical protein
LQRGGVRLPGGTWAGKRKAWSGKRGAGSVEREAWSGKRGAWSGTGRKRETHIIKPSFCAEDTWAEAVALSRRDCEEHRNAAI